MATVAGSASRNMRNQPLAEHNLDRHSTSSGRKTPVRHDLTASYAEKRSDYFTGARRDFVAMLPDDGEASILEIGCGTGATGALALAQGKCQRYVGVELMEPAAAEARKVLTEVITGNVENLDLEFPAASFDALIMSEVLEHLADPWAVLRRLGPMLKPGARVLASSPNVSNWKIIRQLFRGRFDLTERGIMDRTHLRWFTPGTYGEMFESCGFQVDKVYPISPLKPHQQVIAAVLGGKQHLFCSQICVSGRWSGIRRVM